jgi:hypothetical protein
MPSRHAALTALLALQGKPCVKTVQPEEAPSRSAGYCGALGQESLSRVRDRQNAAAEKPVEPQTNASYDQYADEKSKHGKFWADVWAAERNARTRDERIKAQAEKVRLAHIADNQRQLEDQRDRERRAKELQEANSRIILDNITKSEIRGILADATAPEIEAVLQKVRGWKMEKQSFAYSAALKEVREKKV